jgi:hypothetical protein
MHKKITSDAGISCGTVNSNSDRPRRFGCTRCNGCPASDRDETATTSTPG